MPDPQGLFHWPGAERILAGSRFTDTRGIQPGQGVLRVVPDFFFAHGGDLVMTYGGNRIVRTGCKADSVVMQHQGDGTLVFMVKILDRRWRWETQGRISGHYNVREKIGDVEVFAEDTKRTPRQLAELCLRAIGERGYDVSRMPNDSFPPMHWDYERPARALDQVMQAVGATLVLRNDPSNGVVIIPAVDPPGRSSPRLPQDSAPPGPLVIKQDAAVDPPEIPDSIRACVQMKFQLDLELEFVAVDTDGQIVPVSELKYLPKKNGKASLHEAGVPPEWMNLTNLKARDLAKQYLLKMARIKMPFRFPAFGPFKGRTIQRYAEIKPIETLQINKSSERRLGGGVGGNNQQQVEIAKRLPAQVYGIWYDEQETHANVIDKLDPKNIDEVERVLQSNPNRDARQTGIYPHGFNIDVERGLVLFSQPVYALEWYTSAGKSLGFVSSNPNAERPSNAEPGGRPALAVLRLRTTVSLRDPDPRGNYLGWLRMERERKLRGAKFGLGPQWERIDEIGLEVVPKYNASYGVTTASHNLRNVERYLDTKLNEFEAKYQIEDQRSLEYAGFLPIQLTSAVKQVEYYLDGKGHAFTRAERNREEPIFHDTEAQRQLRESIKAGAEFTSRPPAAAKARQQGQDIAPQEGQVILQ